MLTGLLLVAPATCRCYCAQSSPPPLVAAEGGAAPDPSGSVAARVFAGGGGGPNVDSGGWAVYGHAGAGTGVRWQFADDWAVGADFGGGGSTHDQYLLAGRAELSYSPVRLLRLDVGLGGGGLVQPQSTTTYVTVDGWIRLGGTGRVQPYLAVGFAGSFVVDHLVTPGYGENALHNEGYVGSSAGLELSLTNRFDLVLDCTLFVPVSERELWVLADGNLSLRYRFGGADENLTGALI